MSVYPIFAAFSTGKMLIIMLSIKYFLFQVYFIVALDSFRDEIKQEKNTQHTVNLEDISMNEGAVPINQIV